MNIRYAHPILWRKDDESTRSAIVSKDGDNIFDLKQGSTLGKLKIQDIEEFYHDLKKSHEKRVSMGIPRMNYLAFSFLAYGYGKIPSVIKLIEKARELNLEARGWVNEEIASLVVCFATDDLSEDSGWDIYDIYEWANVKSNAESDSYGHSNWWEYCFFGIPIYDTWSLEVRNERLVCVSPDESKFAVFG